MGQNISKIETLYDTLSKEYAKAFSGKHEKKPMDWEMLKRFAREAGRRLVLVHFDAASLQSPFAIMAKAHFRTTNGNYWYSVCIN